jgi:hypothetical protein
MVGTLLVGRSDTGIMAVMLRRASLALRLARSNGMPSRRGNWQMFSRSISAFVP